MDREELLMFVPLDYGDDAIRLRRWDDLAKVAGARTKSLADYRDMIRRVAEAHPPA